MVNGRMSSKRSSPSGSSRSLSRFPRPTHFYIRAPDLDNDIHPVFRFESFRIPFPIWEGFLPALRLASLFLTEESMLQWWIHAALGLPEKDIVTDKIYLRRMENGSMLSALMVTKAALAELAEYVRWEFGYVHQAYGITNIDFERKVPMEHVSSVFERGFASTVYVRLNSSFLDFVEEKYGDSTMTRRIHFDFFLAVCFVHELAHAFGIMRRGVLQEPYYSLCDPEPEHGYSWEVSTFGCKVLPVNNAIDPPSRLFGISWALNAEECKYKRPKPEVLSPTWIASWFSKETWEAIRIHGKTALSNLNSAGGS